MSRAVLELLEGAETESETSHRPCQKKNTPLFLLFLSSRRHAPRLFLALRTFLRTSFSARARACDSSTSFSIRLLSSSFLPFSIELRPPRSFTAIFDV